MRTFLTTTETFRDENNVLRYTNVSWPVYRAIDDGWSVMDTDGTYFTIPTDKGIESEVPGKLANLPGGDYILARKDDGIRDFNKAYKERLGIDVTKNQYAEHAGGTFDEASKIAMINGKYHDSSKVAESHRRNLRIPSEDV